MSVKDAQSNKLDVAVKVGGFVIVEMHVSRLRKP
jgi:hypothetical protein